MATKKETPKKKVVKKSTPADKIAKDLESEFGEVISDDFLDTDVIPYDDDEEE